MTSFWRALFVAAMLNVSTGAGVVLAESVDAQKPAEAKKADEGPKPADAKKPSTAKMPIAAKSREIYQSSPRFLAKKFAVGGHDTVAYHKEMKPVAGKDEFTYAWKDATWRFASKENLEAFIADPEKYAPQYGGYCAYAVAHNGLSPGNPRHWKIIDGKLYLNIDGSVHTKWERQQDEFIKRGNTNWPTVLKK